MSYRRIVVEIILWLHNLKHTSYVLHRTLDKETMARHTTANFSSYPSVLSSSGGNISQETLQSHGGSVAGIDITLNLKADKEL